jgi:expansin (peptidoglycan-binding protein)
MTSWSRRGEPGPADRDRRGGGVREVVRAARRKKSGRAGNLSTRGGNGEVEQRLDGPIERMAMRGTRHAAPQSQRRRERGRGLMTGVPAALLAVGVLVSLAVAFLPGGGPADAGRAVAAAQAGAAPGAGPVTASGTAGATIAAARPTPTGTASASASRSASTSGAASASASASRSASTSGAAAAGSAVAPLAGRIKPSVTYHGVATAYAAADGNGACLFGPTSDLMVAAMNYTDYESSKACGDYVLVRAANGASLTVRIVNECPLPCAPGQLDLSQQAFARLANLSVGRLPITWTLLSPASPGPLSLRYQTGSSRWWCSIQVIGHRNPVALLEVRTGSGWRRLARTDYNYFLSSDGSGCGGPIRITDIYGQQLTVDGIALRPNVAQPTGVQFARH